MGVGCVGGWGGQWGTWAGLKVEEVEGVEEVAEGSMLLPDPASPCQVLCPRASVAVQA